MKLTLDNINTIYLEDPGHARDICDNQILFNREAKAYNAGSSYIVFDDLGGYRKIQLGIDAKIEDVLVSDLPEERFRAFQRQATMFGYTMNRTVQGVTIWPDELVAKLSNDQEILLRADSGVTAGMFGNGYPIQAHALVWDFINGSFSKAITEHEDYYRVIAWGKFSLFGLTFGGLIPIENVRKHYLYVSESNTEIIFRYSNMNISMCCQKWSDTTVSLIGVTFDVKY